MNSLTGVCDIKTSSDSVNKQQTKLFTIENLRANVKIATQVFTMYVNGYGRHDWYIASKLNGSLNLIGSFT